ncbi:hypothetical protein [Methylopila sp. M107]|nr:hypothetical protein [Methylopila sp. M107]
MWGSFLIAVLAPVIPAEGQESRNMKVPEKSGERDVSGPRPFGRGVG